MSLLQRFKEYTRRHHLFSKEDRLLLGISGGMDSVVLAELCHQAGMNFAIAHCNFQLRGKESDRDEAFVNQLAKRYQAVFFIRRFETLAYSAEKKISIQEAARLLRYAWFDELLTEPENSGTGPARQPLKYVVTAHHADDNIETLLMNFFRGTGIRGLKGIEPRFGHIVRPLLCARKKEIEHFLQDNQLEYVEDSSNREDEYTRNYFRNRLIPSIEKVYPGVRENLLANITRFSDAADLYRQAVDLHKKKLLEKKGNEVHIPVLKLKKIKPLATLVYEILNEFGFTPLQSEESIKLLDSESGKFIQSLTHRVIKNRNWLIIAPVGALPAQTILVEAGTGQVSFENGRLELKVIQEATPETTSQTACLDAALVEYPLLLRRWKQGDYFYPLGMKKKKKLSRFFIDQKMSKTEKEKTWVLESNQRILWVVGHRIDDRFKITGKTKEVLRIHLEGRLQ